MKTIIYTDGSSRGNPGRGGWGAVVMTEHHVKELGGRENMTTNNRMELIGAIEGLQEVSRYSLVVSSGHDSIRLTNNNQRPTIIEVHTDSQYVKKGMTEWIDGWIAKGWKGSNKKAVLNQDLWQALKKEEDKLKEAGVKIVWKYVKAHVGIVGNERTDTIATEFADANDLQLYDGPRSGYHF